MNINDEGFGLGIQRCDPEKVACRTCKNALNGGIAKAICRVYDGSNGVKPDDVYFENAPCKAYIEGEDLLDYEFIE